MRLKMHYQLAVEEDPHGVSYWNETRYVLWSAFCLQWVAVAWLMLIGAETTGHERTEEAA